MFLSKLELVLVSVRYATDWEVTSVSEAETVFPITGKLFISDVPRTARPRNGADRKISYGDVLKQICQLQHLEYLNLLKNIALSDLQRILASCSNLARGSFNCNGRNISGDRKTFQAALKLRPENFSSTSI